MANPSSGPADSAWVEIQMMFGPLRTGETSISATTPRSALWPSFKSSSLEGAQSIAARNAPTRL
jgi:hypothetical protein